LVVHWSIGGAENRISQLKKLEYFAKIIMKAFLKISLLFKALRRIERRIE